MSQARPTVPLRLSVTEHCQLDCLYANVQRTLAHTQRAKEAQLQPIRLNMTVLRGSTIMTLKWI
jgi:molybdenum cofactor biosynthesis enzyme MoaA